jgi:hypothetical protein
MTPAARRMSGLNKEKVMTTQSEFLMPFVQNLDEEGVVQRRKKASRVTLATMAVIFLGAMALLRFGLFLLDGGPSHDEMITPTIFMAVIALCVTMLLGPPASRQLAREGWDSDSYAWLAPSKCKELADLCERHEALGAYRNHVCKLGRRFTAGEYAAMRQWAEASVRDAEHADDCRRLYQIA